MTKTEIQEVIDHLTTIKNDVAFSKSCVGQTEVRVNITYFNKQTGIIITENDFDNSFNGLNTDLDAKIASLTIAKESAPDA